VITFGVGYHQGCRASWDPAIEAGKNLRSASTLGRQRASVPSLCLDQITALSESSTQHVRHHHPALSVFMVGGHL